MSLELKKRIITSFFLFILLYLMIFSQIFLIISLIIIGIISWIEFYALISKIFLKNNNKDKILRFLFKMISLIYISFLIILIINIIIYNPVYKIYIFYSLSISIATDIGGLIIGKLFKGKKLTKISPNKTISGSIGSFIISLLLVPFFINFLSNYDLFTLIFITLLISLSSQLGDLLISHIKRMAKVKDTSDLLPGHGGFLDRVDGIIFSIPFGFLLFNIF